MLKIKVTCSCCSDDFVETYKDRLEYEQDLLDDIFLCETCFKFEIGDIDEN